MRHTAEQERSKEENRGKKLVVPAAPVPPLEILLTLEQEVENEEEGWWLWLDSG